MFGLSDLQKTRVYQEAKQEGEQRGGMKAGSQARRETGDSNPFVDIRVNSGTNLPSVGFGYRAS